MRKQIIADHEKYRREKAISLLQYWNDKEPEFRSIGPIRRIIEELSPKQLKRMFEGKSIELNASCKLDLLNVFQSEKLDIRIKSKDEIIGIDELGVKRILNILTAYLNLLEIISTAWRHHVADREIIEEEFQNVIAKKENRIIFEKVQQRSHLSSYPSLSELIKTIQEKKSLRVHKSPIA